MITGSDIVYFYDAYRKNLKKEERILGGLLQASDQEAWMAKIRQKVQVMRNLYTENEALLNLYVRPFTEDEARLNDELADAFLKQVIICHRGLYEDDMAIREVTEMLERYFKKQGNRDGEIQALTILGGIYNGACLPEETTRCSDCFRQIVSYSDDFFNIADADVRKRIIFSHYNYIISLINFRLVSDEEVLRLLDKALAFYRDERVRAITPDFDFDGLIEELDYDVLGSCIANCSDKPSEHLLSRARAVLGKLYEEKLRECENKYQILDEIYCNYHRCLFLCGEISFDEFIRDYKAFCDYVYEHEQMDSQPGVSFMDSRLYQVAINHLPAIIELIQKYGKDKPEYAQLRRDCLEKYLSIVRQVPRVGGNAYVTDSMCKTLTQMLELIPDDEVNGRIIMQLLLNRDEITLLHSSMVGQLASRILDAVFEHAPELLVGAPECPNLVAVLENRERIHSFIWGASQAFDIGKLGCGEVISKQSRNLTARERKRLQYHIQNGADMVANSAYLSRYKDIILGHHKSYDGKLGYPADFDNTASPYRFYIELFHICDCVDAATDYLGRSYRTAKSFSECLEELELGMGSLYSPELVSLLLSDETLQSDLSYILSAGRNRTYYEIYSRNIGNVSAVDSSPEDTADAQQRQKLLNLVQESETVSSSLAKALANGSMLVLSVDLRSADYRVVYRDTQPLFASLKDGKYSDFLNDTLCPIVEAEDWKKYGTELRLSKLIHRLGEHSGTYEAELRLKTGESYRWTRFRFVQTDEFNAIPSEMAVTLQDVHENKQRMEQLMAEMKRSYRAAEAASRAKTEFLSHMSHDIRTPMNGIIGMTRIALKNMDNRDRVQDCLNKIDESSKHLLRLINEVLDMSRIESGTAELSEEPMRFGEVFREACNICRPDAERKQQCFTQDLEPDSTVVLSDETRLRQVMINLIGNAIKYTPEGGTVTACAHQLALTPDGHAVYRFDVKDNGIGMSAEFQEKMFEPFSREDTSLTGKVPGTGLGLSITKSIVDMMDGRIQVDSEKGRGSSFSVTLRFPVAQTEAGKPQAAEDVDVRPDFTGHRILLAEDNELNSEIALELLHGLGLTVETAENGQEAMEKVRDSGDGYYELVFMDIQMPLMNGYEATRAIRALGTSYAKELPIIAMTANAFKSDVANALHSGMNGHTPKPIDIKQVCALLKKWLA